MIKYLKLLKASANWHFNSLTISSTWQPIERQLQLLAVLYATSEFLLFGWAALFLFVYLLFTPYYWLSLLYGAWMYYDRHTADRGGRLQPWARKLTLWKYFADYFPLKLEKTAELDPAKNYILGYHPHGIMSIGAFGNFATEGTGFSRLFPGITSRLVTLPIIFKLPLHRDVGLTTGCISTNRNGIEYSLKEQGRGNAIVVVVGGAAEAINALPGTMRLTLKNRKGFVRLALRNGANLVPVVSFGENDLYNQLHLADGSRWKAWQRKVSKLLTFSPLPFYGRGILHHTIGYIPYRKPVTTIVGRPIDVALTPEPTEEEIDRLHRHYIVELKKLYYANRHRFGPYRNVEMEIV